MKPDIIVLIGDFFSSKSQESLSYDEFVPYFEIIGHIIRERDLVVLRDLTNWILVPSVDDPGMTKLMPCMKLSEHFLSGFKGTGPSRIKNLTLATNPCRISYYGQEIVIAKYSFFKKLKRNHLSKFSATQERVRVAEQTEYEDTYRVAKTIVHQGNLMPFSQVVQPIIWSYGEAFNLTPHPHILILADDCEDYHHRIQVEKEGEKEIKKE